MFPARSWHAHLQKISSVFIISANQSTYYRHCNHKRASYQLTSFSELNWVVIVGTACKVLDVFDSNFSTAISQWPPLWNPDRKLLASPFRFHEATNLTRPISSIEMLRPRITSWSFHPCSKNGGWETVWMLSPEFLLASFDLKHAWSYFSAVVGTSWGESKFIAENHERNRTAVLFLGANIKARRCGMFLEINFQYIQEWVSPNWKVESDLKSDSSWMNCIIFDASTNHRLGLRLLVWPTKRRA